LVIRDQAQAIFRRSPEYARAQGYVKGGKMRLALDSTMVLGHGKEVWRACPRYAECVTDKRRRGRFITLHPDEEMLQQARALEKTDYFREQYRQRVVVEHRIGRLVQLRIRQSRFFGPAKTRFLAPHYGCIGGVGMAQDFAEPGPLMAPARIRRFLVMTLLLSIASGCLSFEYGVCTRCREQGHWEAVALRHAGRVAPAGEQEDGRCEDREVQTCARGWSAFWRSWVCVWHRHGPSRRSL